MNPNLRKGLNNFNEASERYAQKSSLIHIQREMHNLPLKDRDLLGRPQGSWELTNIRLFDLLSALDGGDSDPDELTKLKTAVVGTELVVAAERQLDGAQWRVATLWLKYGKGEDDCTPVMVFGTNSDEEENPILSSDPEQASTPKEVDPDSDEAMDIQLVWTAFMDSDDAWRLALQKANA